MQIWVIKKLLLCSYLVLSSLNPCMSKGWENKRFLLILCWMAGRVWQTRSCLPRSSIHWWRWNHVLLPWKEREKLLPRIRSQPPHKRPLHRQKKQQHEERFHVGPIHSYSLWQSPTLCWGPQNSHVGRPHRPTCPNIRWSTYNPLRIGRGDVDILHCS